MLDLRANTLQLRPTELTPNKDSLVQSEIHVTSKTRMDESIKSQGPDRLKLRNLARERDKQVHTSVSRALTQIIL